MKKLLAKISVAGFFCLNVCTSNAQYGWTQKANFPGAARTGAACFSIGHYGYVGCGNNSSASFNDWWRWNQDSNTWMQITSYPGAGLQGCISFSINGYGYVGLGITSTTETDFWRYDTSNNSWTQMATFPGTPRYGTRSFVIGTNAYIVGGNSGGPPYLYDCWRYNSLTNTWTQMTSFPLSGYAPVLTFTIGSYGYAGCGGSGGFGTLINSMYQYDTTSNSWTAIASVPSTAGLGDPACFVMADTAYSVSGFTNTDEYFHEVFSYNSSTNVWNTFSNFLGMPRKWGKGFSIGNKGYVSTGQDSTGAYHADLWQYAPINTSGIIDISNSNSILTYPNPAKDEIYIQLNGNEKAEMLELYTITGQRVVSTQLSVGSNNKIMGIKTTGLDAGVYFLKVQMQDGSTMVKKVEILK